MKRYGNLYQRIIDTGNIALAHHNAKKGKGRYAEVKMVESAPEYYLGQVREMLAAKTFHTAPYRKKIVFDSGKLREIYKLPYFPDRIVHHAVMNVLQPLWDRTFIYDCYSAVPGKGIHAGLARLHRFMRDEENTRYCLKGQMGTMNLGLPYYASAGLSDLPPLSRIEAAKLRLEAKEAKEAKEVI